MNDTTAPAPIDTVLEAVRSVDDPEYPGVSIVDLGMLSTASVADGVASVELLPTFTGCPALPMIRADVEVAVLAVPGVRQVEVSFVDSPVWTPDRITDTGRSALAEEFTVAIRTSRPVRCPRCKSPAVEETSMFGPTRCRSTARCSACGEHLEVMRA